MHKKSILTLILFLLFPGTGISSVCVYSYNPSIYSYSKVVADFNNDGIDDEYEIFDEHSNISLSKDGIKFDEINNIHEAWAISNEMTKSTYGIPTEVISGDINNDGYDDVIAAFGSRIIIRLNMNGTGFTNNGQQLKITDLYELSPHLITELMLNYNSKLALIDINSDGYKDLLIVHYSGVSVFINRTDGKFSSYKRHLIDGINVIKINEIVVSNIDTDLSPEAIISSRGSYIVNFDINHNIEISIIPNQSDTLEQLDFDNDGDIDFHEVNLSTCSPPIDNEKEHYWINNGNAVFTEKIVSTNGDIDPFVIDVETSSDKNTNSGGGALDYLFAILLLLTLLNKSSTIVVDCKKA